MYKRDIVIDKVHHSLCRNLVEILVANKLTSDVFVEYLRMPTTADAAVVHDKTKQPVAFHSITA